MRFFIFISALLLLASCGADVASTAATTATLQAEQAKQAQETLDKARTDLEAAQKTVQQRRDDSDAKN